jgi:hypothetical protein
MPSVRPQYLLLSALACSCHREPPTEAARGASAKVEAASTVGHGDVVEAAVPNSDRDAQPVSTDCLATSAPLSANEQATSADIYDIPWNSMFRAPFLTESLLVAGAGTRRTTLESDEMARYWKAYRSLRSSPSVHGTCGVDARAVVMFTTNSGAQHWFSLGGVSNHAHRGRGVSRTSSADVSGACRPTPDSAIHQAG